MSNWLRLNNLKCIVPYNTESKDKLNLVYGNNRQRFLGAASYDTEINLKTIPLLPLTNPQKIKLSLKGMFGKKTELGLLEIAKTSTKTASVEAWLANKGSYRLLYNIMFEGSRIFVKPVQLDCAETMNTFGQDKIYITVGKKKLLSKTKIKKGSSISLKRIRPIPFTGKLTFGVYSTEFIKPDSLIGQHTVNFNLKSTGAQTAIFDNGTCLYNMNYEIMQFDTSG